jgi:hypothetical protein
VAAMRLVASGPFARALVLLRGRHARTARAALRGMPHLPRQVPHNATTSRALCRKRMRPVWRLTARRRGHNNSQHSAHVNAGGWTRTALPAHWYTGWRWCWAAGVKTANARHIALPAAGGETHHDHSCTTKQAAPRELAVGYPVQMKDDRTASDAALWTPATTYRYAAYAVVRSERGV